MLILPPDKLLSISATIPEARSFYRQFSLQAACFLLHDLWRDQVLKIAIMFE